MFSGAVVIRSFGLSGCRLAKRSEIEQVPTACRFLFILGGFLERNSKNTRTRERDEKKKRKKKHHSSKALAVGEPGRLSLTVEPA